MKGVFANVALKAKTLILAGGQFVSHWEYLAMRRVDPASVSTWLRIEDPHLKGPRKSHALWFIPSRANPLVAALHEFVVGETGVTTTAEPNLHIVWSVFADKGFSSSSRILYYVARYLNVGTRLHAPPLMRFIQDHPWTAISEANAVETEAAFARCEVCPHGDEVYLATAGHPSRDGHIHGFFTMAFVGKGCARGAEAVSLASLVALFLSLARQRMVGNRLRAVLAARP